MFREKTTQQKLQDLFPKNANVTITPWSTLKGNESTTGFSLRFPEQDSPYYSTFVNEFIYQRHCPNGRTTLRGNNPYIEDSPQLREILDDEKQYATIKRNFDNIELQARKKPTSYEEVKGPTRKWITETPTRQQEATDTSDKKPKRDLKH